MLINEPKLKNRLGTITVSISTCGERIVGAISVASDFAKLGLFVDIIHQSNIPHDYDESIDSHIRYFHMKTRGVTKSRNYAIDVCLTKYIWFMDDDINLSQFTGEMLDGLLCDMNDNDIHIALTKVMDENNNFRKKYPSEGIVTDKKKIISVGTIEIIGDIEFIKKQEIKFNEAFGAGAKLPVGDEALFLNDVIKSKGTIKSYDLSFISHPRESSGVVNSREVYLSRGIVFKKIFGSIGLVYLVYLLVFRINILKEPRALEMIRGFLGGGRR